MPITQFLEDNVKKYPNDICLVEVNPEIQEKRRVTWRDYELIEANPTSHYRREITWHVFDEKANRFAEEPEFVKEQYLTPNHSAKPFSNLRAHGPAVNQKSREESTKLTSSFSSK